MMNLYECLKDVPVDELPTVLLILADKIEEDGEELLAQRIRKEVVPTMIECHLSEYLPLVTISFIDEEYNDECYMDIMPSGIKFSFIPF